MREEVDKTIKEKLEEQKAARAARLAELQRLTGCPMALVIEGRCEELGCQNSLYVQSGNPAIPEEICQRVKQLVNEEGLSKEEFLVVKEVLREEMELETAPELHKIYDTKPRLRCVL